MKNLTQREEEILLQVIKGKINTNIAKNLFISSSTVKAHVSNLLRKMNAKNRTILALKSQLYFKSNKIKEILNEIDEEYNEYEIYKY